MTVHVNPQLCFDTADGTPSGVEYTRLITPLLRMNQEQQVLIETQASKITQLESTLASVLTRLAALENK